MLLNEYGQNAGTTKYYLTLQCPMLLSFLCTDLGYLPVRTAAGEEGVVVLVVPLNVVIPVHVDDRLVGAAVPSHFHHQVREEAPVKRSGTLE